VDAQVPVPIEPGGDGRRDAADAELDGGAVGYALGNQVGDPAVELGDRR
jgi:hypothetical protein